MEGNSEVYGRKGVNHYVNTGLLLKKAREFLGFSLEEVAGNVNLKQSQLEEIEKGSRTISSEILEELSKIYDRPTEWFSGSLQSRNSPDDIEFTPLPYSFHRHQRVYREFQQFISSKHTDSNDNDKLERLRTYAGGNYPLEMLHEELKTYDSSMVAGRVNVLDAISQIGVSVILRPLKNVIGTLLQLDQNTGLMLSILQSTNELRFATASALSRLLIRHKKEEPINIKAWYPLVAENDLRKIDSSAFDTVLDLLLPNFLLVELQKKQKWADNDMFNPFNIYQASLRLGASYQATVKAYERLGCFTNSESCKLLKVKLLDIKKELLEDVLCDNLDNIDVWVLSENEEGTKILANPNDLIVLRLRQKGSAGYRWDLDAFEKAGFSILKDTTNIVDFEKVGSPSLRTVISKPRETSNSEIAIKETCPWRRRIPQSNEMKINCRYVEKPKEGLYRRNIQFPKDSE